MAYAVQRLCSDFMDMLRRRISCRIIIIIIIMNPTVESCIQYSQSMTWKTSESQDDDDAKRDC